MKLVKFASMFGVPAAFAGSVYGDKCNPELCQEWTCKNWCDCFEEFPEIEGEAELERLCPADDTADDCDCEKGNHLQAATGATPSEAATGATTSPPVTFALTFPLAVGTPGGCGEFVATECSHASTVFISPKTDEGKCSVPNVNGGRDEVPCPKVNTGRQVCEPFPDDPYYTTPHESWTRTKPFATNIDAAIGQQDGSTTRPAQPRGSKPWDTKIICTISDQFLREISAGVDVHGWSGNDFYFSRNNGIMKKYMNTQEKMDALRAFDCDAPLADNPLWPGGEEQRVWDPTVKQWWGGYGEHKWVTVPHSQIVHELMCGTPDYEAKCEASKDRYSVSTQCMYRPYSIIECNTRVADDLSADQIEMLQLHGHTRSHSDHMCPLSYKGLCDCKHYAAYRAQTYGYHAHRSYELKCTTKDYELQNWYKNEFCQSTVTNGGYKDKMDIAMCRANGGQRKYSLTCATTAYDYTTKSFHPSPKSVGCGSAGSAKVTEYEYCEGAEA